MENVGKASFTDVTCMWMISSQLCLVHTCALIWSPPTRLSTRAPPWEPFPPPPSLSTWTTKQRRGTALTCSPIYSFWLLSFYNDTLCWFSGGMCSLSTLNHDPSLLYTEGGHVNLLRPTHTHTRHCHLCSYITWSCWWRVSWNRWLNWLGYILWPIDIHTLLHNIQIVPVKGWVVWCGCC